jgi:hypothetical protein
MQHIINEKMIPVRRLITLLHITECKYKEFFGPGGEKDVFRNKK